MLVHMSSARSRQGGLDCCSNQSRKWLACEGIHNSALAWRALAPIVWGVPLPVFFLKTDFQTSQFALRGFLPTPRLPVVASISLKSQLELGVISAQALGT